MDQLEAKINQLVIEKSDAKKTFVRSFATKPAKGLAGKKGKIFGLIEIESANSKIPDLIDLIIEEIKNNFYHQLKEAPADISEQFEITLKKTNLAVMAFLEKEDIIMDLKKINIIIALSHKQELLLTTVGTIGAILFYKTADSKYRIIDILEDTQSSLAAPDPLRLFSQIISGKISPQDVLFITTANLLDYFSIERIKNIITRRSAAESMIELKQIIEETKSRENFGVLTLNLEKVTAPAEKSGEFKAEEFDYRRAASKDSMRDLIKTERETEKLLTPSVMPEIKKYAQHFKIACQNYLSKAENAGQTFKQKQKLTPENIKLAAKIKEEGIIQKAIQSIRSSIKKITNIIFKQPFWSRLSILAQRLFGRLYIKFKRLPRSSKILLIFVVILAILFSQSVIWLRIKNQQEEGNKKFNEIIIEIENKKNDAASSLIYRDESQARLFLAEAKKLLAELDSYSQAQKDQIALLSSDLEEKIEKLRHAIRIAEPVQIVNFSNLDNEAKIAKLAILNQETLYTQNNNNQSIYKANLNTRVMSAIYSPDINTGNLISGISINSDEIIFLNEAKAVFSLNPNNDTIQTVAVNINGNASIADAATYKDWLYLLDSATSQIYRYSKTETGYGNVVSWIKQTGLNLTNARSLAIDGSVYILKASGEIIRLENNVLADFEAAVIDPVFESPTKIKTAEGSNYLYILDPPAKRLVVLDKQGNLVSQYVSEKFDDLKDFIVVERDKKIYFLNGSIVFGVGAEHL